MQALQCRVHIGHNWHYRTLYGEDAQCHYGTLDSGYVRRAIADDPGALLRRYSGRYCIHKYVKYMRVDRRMRNPSIKRFDSAHFRW